MKLPPGFVGRLFRAVAAGGTRVAATGAGLFKRRLATVIKSGNILSGPYGSGIEEFSNNKNACIIEAVTKVLILASA